MPPNEELIVKFEVLAGVRVRGRDAVEDLKLLREWIFSTPVKEIILRA